MTNNLYSAKRFVFGFGDSYFEFSEKYEYEFHQDILRAVTSNPKFFIRTSLPAKKYLCLCRAYLLKVRMYSFTSQPTTCYLPTKVVLPSKAAATT